MSNKNIILANAEHYIEPISKSGGFGPVKYPREYEDARDRLIGSVSYLESYLKELDNNYYVKDDVVICLRLNKKFTAKSYFPEKFIKETGMSFVGSRRWRIKDNDFSKMIFLRGNSARLKNISEMLDSSEKKLTDEWKNNCKIIENIDVLEGKEQLLGFDNWQRGKTELVFHPMGHSSEQAFKLFKKLLRQVDVDISTMRDSIYSSGIRFATANLNKSQLERLVEFNPLRTAHPMFDVELPIFRGVASNGPSPSGMSEKSVITVGVFDSGVELNVPLIKNHVTETSLSDEPVRTGQTGHGTAVAGAVLYGPLNSYGQGAQVPHPRVSVESFRVSPFPNEFYDIVDRIEEVVASRPDIKVYNVSFGPPGMILDDAICRFTFSLDKLSYERKVLFTIACGNTGKQRYPLSRIQSPSDSMNNIAVGAWTNKIADKKVTKIRAPYSCIGPGREGAKIKPDVLAFGGCDQHPIHLVSTVHNNKHASDGTSFSAPLIAGMAGELLGRCDRLTSLGAKALIIHTANNIGKNLSHEDGFGVACSSIDEVLTMTDHQYTVLFQKSLRPGSYAKLPIPFIEDLTDEGRITIEWTVTSLANPDITNTDEYSQSCVVDTFYPNASKFGFSKQKPDKKWQSKRLDLRYDSEEAERLKSQGWVKNKWPDSASGNQFKKKESDMVKDFKWDITVKRSKRFEAAGVSEPFLILHSLNRNTEDLNNTDYSVAVTVSYSKPVVDLANKIKENYIKLAPLELRPLTKLYVQV